ncbi:MAG: GNAT family N-acetyltransferase [Colwellia sp.]|nr:GNAT family N-acetyltransferase [Colwellia sp.]
MTDMIVKLYDLQPINNGSELSEPQIIIKQALALDKKQICQFIEDNFSDICPGWVDECTACLLSQPTRCFIAVYQEQVIGFCCYDSTAKGMLGPLGVHHNYRNKGIARKLMFQCFFAMKAAGYAYAVIGWVSSTSFYQKSCNAIEIPDSFPGVYQRMVTQV